MYDILVYLFETCLSAEACPEPEQLAHKLAAAGFDKDEISQALEWLSGLQHGADTAPPAPAGGRSLRLFGEHELGRLGADCRGFLQFLENTGVVDAPTRETIIERAMALTNVTMSLASFKLIALMVLWSRRQPLDSLLVDELLSENEEHSYH